MSKIVDLSHYQEPSRINYASMKAAGIAGVIIKISEGEAYRDPRAVDHVRRAKAAGLPVGAYHFMKPGVPAQIQVDNFVRSMEEISAVAQGTVPGVFNLRYPFWLDCENGTGGWGQVSKWTRVVRVCNFIRNLEAKYPGHPCGIYTGRPFWDQFFSEKDGPATEIGKSVGIDISIRPLWISAYHNPIIPPRLPGTWKTYCAWQYTSAGRVNGAPMNVDLSLAKW